MADLLTEIREEWRLFAADKGLSFRVHSPAYWIWSDRDMLATVVANLVSNAIRYTERGGIVVGCRRAGEQLKIEVYDTGIGIPAEAQEQIFLQYTQLKRKADEGFGLGLSIVRRTAELLGHPVEVYSTVGKGSRFSVTVPLATAPGRPLVLPFVSEGIGESLSTG